MEAPYLIWDFSIKMKFENPSIVKVDNFVIVLFFVQNLIYFSLLMPFKFYDFLDMLALAPPFNPSFHAHVLCLHEL